MNKKKKAFKKSTPVKRKYVKKSTQQVNLQPFEIEVNPPNYRLNPELDVTLKRIDSTLPLIKPGQAFVVPSKSRQSIKKHLSEKYPNLIFVYSIIKDNSKTMRIYLVKSVNR